MANIKLNQEMIEKACNYLRQGHYAVVVCEFLGISEATYYSYINQGKEDEKNGKESIFLEFLKSIKKAEAEAEMRHIQNILKTATEGNWTASAWYLERKHKNRWSLKQEIEHTGSQTIRVEVTDD